MRILNAAVGAALLILVASPALAGDPRGGGHSGGGQHGGGSCGGGCGGGHPPPSHGGGNINVNVNANASASANAFAGASAGGYFNARTYDMGGFRGGGYGGGTVYVGGGYGGDGGGCYGGCGGAIYNEEIHEGRTCASAPFGYVVYGFGRTGRRAPACVADTGVCRGDDDRGGRYGYSERHGCGGGGRREDHGYEGGSHSSYESHETYEEYGGRCGGGCGGRPDYGIGDYERGYIDGRNSCGGRVPGGHDDDHGGDDYAPYPPPYQPEPPRYEPPAPPARPYQPPRQRYSQEPGERG
jgi:hypothetical protein